MSSSFLAINVAILLPDDLQPMLRDLNADIWHSSHVGYLFDDSHLPHITLLQQFIEKKDLPSVKLTLQSAIAGLSSSLIRLVRIERVPFADNLPSFTILLEKSAELQALHERVFHALEPFAVAGGSAEAFFAEGGSGVHEKCVVYVQSFRTAYSRKTYDPHITIGLGNQEPPVLESAIDAKVAQVALCHLGNFCSCRSVYVSWMLRG